ncbi:MAG: transporter substrate-binding domain-containing protein, partial [Lachnospira sp.]|nr:transporter substrate-binding domain-containing protein [Lachnospira sp.]
MKLINKRTRSLAVIIAITLCFLPILALTGCGKEIAENKVFSADDLSGKVLGVQLGTTGDIFMTDYEKDGSGTKVERFSKGSDAIQSLKLGKVDAVVIDIEPAKAFVKANGELMILEEPFVTEDYAICVAKENKDLTSRINTALAQLKSEGTLEKIINNYIGDAAGNSPYVSPDNINRNNGTLTMATNAYFKPYEYYENGKIVGIDVDMANAIADKLG